MATQLKPVVNDNMRVWNAVCRTDPDYTKKVNQRGGFTAIAAQYQIMMATEQFGPIGEGWGYSALPPIFQNSMVIVPVKIWHGNRSNEFGPVYGCAEMFGKYPDHDAPKKATTDAITKGLSQLGFNADVFLGMYDDNKYIEAMRKEFAPASEKISDEQWLILTGLIEEVGANAGDVCKAYKAESLRDLTHQEFEHARGILSKRIKKEA